MDDYVVNTFANRDEPIPVLSFPENGASDDEGSKHTQEQLSTGAVDAGEGEGGKNVSTGTSHKRSSSLQDRLLTKLLQQVIPSEGGYGPGSTSKWTRSSSSKYLNRPNFSLPLMTNNFRRFNARIGVVFVFQANAIRLFSWQRYSHTLSFLAIYSFVCIYPYLLVVAPFCFLLFFVMVPSYLARHPPPPGPSLSAPRQSLDGPPMLPARVIKPANEMSHDFFHNMRDLQNCMDDFAVIHDIVLEAVTPYTNFADQELSSAIFLMLTCSLFCLYLAAPLVPWRHICLFSGWALILLGHPGAQSAVNRAYTNSDGATWRSELSSKFHSWVASDIIVDEEPEVLEVEVFELQHRRLPPSFHAEGSDPTPYAREEPSLDSARSSLDGPASVGRQSADGRAHSTPPSPPRYIPLTAAEWESWVFTPSAWEPQAPSRLAGERPRGTRFFEDVRPPPGWAWAGKKWVLDLEGQSWVQDRLLGSMEVEVEGERWVYDLVGGGGSGGEGKGGKKAKKGKAKAAQDREELPAYRGEWRRRRWVRAVKRARLDGRAAAKVLSDEGQQGSRAKR